jgi:hypothetical protein
MKSTKHASPDQARKKTQAEEMNVPVERIGQTRSMLTLMDGRVMHATDPFALVRRN